MGGVGMQPGRDVRCEIGGGNTRPALESNVHKWRGGDRSALSSGEVNSYKNKKNWRGQITGLHWTLSCDTVACRQD